MAILRRIGRRFPDYGWSWPTGGLDQLLKAALLADEDAARRNATAWLDRHDIDKVDFREHRLLAAIADRFGKTLSAHAAYPRLAGLQRMLWTKSRMAMREAEPALAAMTAESCAVMLLKGAGRLAVDPSAQRGRVAHDIDVLVKPASLLAAFDILRAQGWQIATGVSPQYLRPRLLALRSVNFFKGTFGDFDLHQAAYDWSQASEADDEALWRRAVPAQFASVPVLAPSPADRMAMAIGHGGLDAHTHSDWLVDCAVATRTGEVDWAVLADVIGRRGLAVPAAIALSYLANEIGVAVPAPALADIVAAADRAGLARWSGVLQAKPRTDFGPLIWLSRGLAKQLRLKRKSAQRARHLPDIVWRGRSAKISATPLNPDFALTHTLTLPDALPAAPALDLTLLLDLPPARRRVEMEINCGERHLVRLRKRILSAGGGTRILRFGGTLHLQPGERTLTIEARPSRQFREWDNAETIATYGAVPFRVIAADFSG